MRIFENKILSDARGLFVDAGKVLLAVSGGADSVAMAYALAGLKKQGRLSCEFVVGHVNHCLRGAESDADEVFVRTLAESLAIPFAAQVVDVKGYAKKNKLSIETAGRKLRLQALMQMAESYHCQRIATAHHADDQAETLIHCMMRGTGFRGLCGIRPISVVGGAVYVRPLLAVRRDEILGYCREHEIRWREDKSNSDLQFTRNRIRHRLLPELQADSDLTELLAKLSTAAQGLQRRLDDVLSSSLEELCAGEHGFSRVCFNQEKLNACSPWTFYEIIRLGVVTIGGGLRGYSRSHFDAIGEMAARSKAKADFPGKLEVVVENDTVTIQRKGYTSPKGKCVEGVLMFPGDTVEFGPWKISSRQLRAGQAEINHFLETKDDFIEWFDADKIAGPLIIRQRQTGDRFWPIGGKGEKKVGRFLIDSGLDAKAKQQAIIIADAEKILWVAPIRMSEQVKINSKTRYIVEIRMSRRA